MKQIELTPKHIEKLLEMCKALYSEYKRIEIEEYQIDIDRNLDFHSPIFVDLYRGDLKVPFDIISIHWFEFCMLHLFPKLECRYMAEPLADFYYVILYYDKNVKDERFIHPVDYLYKMFKQITL